MLTSAVKAKRETAKSDRRELARAGLAKLRKEQEAGQLAEHANHFEPDSTKLARRENYFYERYHF